MAMTQKLSITEYRNIQAGVRKRNKREEGKLSNLIEQFLNLKGYENDRINSGSVLVHKRYTSKKTGNVTDHIHKVKLAKTGTPDRWFLYKGCWVLIETKLKGGKPSSEQIKRQKELESAGAKIINADSFESFETQFKLITTEIDER